MRGNQKELFRMGEAIATNPKRSKTDPQKGGRTVREGWKEEEDE